MFLEHFYLVNICLESVTLIHGLKNIYSFAIVCKRYKIKIMNWTGTESGTESGTDNGKYPVHYRKMQPLQNWNKNFLCSFLPIIGNVWTGTEKF